MSEIKRTFLQGKMNTDADERLVPDGQTVYSLNNLIAKSEGSDVGAIENSLGNEQKTFLGLTDAVTIGKYQDDARQQIYYFVTSLEKDLVIEYDDRNEALTILLESTRVNDKTLLNFRTDKLITGVVKIINGRGDGDLLGWTDDNEQPRLINIERAATYPADGFTEDDISLIKRPPIYAPDVNLTFSSERDNSTIEDKFISFSYAYKYLDGQVSALAPFSKAAFASRRFNLDPNTMENNGMQNAFTAVDVYFETGEKQVTDVILVFKESNSPSLYIVDVFNKKNNEWGDNQTKKFRFSEMKIYGLMNDNQLFRLFDAVPRKAKAMDVVGNRIAIANYLEGYNLVDKFGEKLNINFNLSLFTRDLTGSTLPYELQNYMIVDDFLNLDLTGVELKEDSRLTFDLRLIDNGVYSGSYKGVLDFILNQDYVDAVELANSTEFTTFIQEVFTNDFIANFTITPPDNSDLDSYTGFIIDSSSPTSILLRAPITTYKIDNTPSDVNDSDFSYEQIDWKFVATTDIAYKEVGSDSSIKTNRSYEVAQIYLDEYGRSTPALTCGGNTLYIPQKNSITQNKIRVNVNHRAPDWAKYYRFAIKQNKKDYQTIFANVFYEDGLFRWVRLDGANKDKVQEGDTLIVKSDLGGVLEKPVKVRVLDVKTQPKDFLTENENENGDPLIEEAGLYMKIKPSGFDMNFNDGTIKIFENGNHLRYPVDTYTKPKFGTYVDGVFKPYALNAGASVRIFIEFKARGAIAYTATYDKKLAVNDNYASVQEWYNAEVKDLGSFGDNYTRGYGFSANGDSFYVRAHRDGTASRKITTTVRFEILFTEGFVIFETDPKDDLSDIYYEIGQTFTLSDGYHAGNIQNQTIEDPAIIELDFFNCFAQGHGIESYRYKDAINSNFLTTDTRPTTDTSKEFKEIHRYADITYSEPFIESLGINGLSEFNLANANYKDDIIKKYGSIQKIIARESNLLVFQEDKVSKILYGKALVMSPDGGENLSGIDEVLGTQVTYAGEHGISRNPESVAIDGNRVYFTDEKRNHVCRLSIDGITVISEYGMNAYFREMFTSTMNKAKLGAFDPYTGKYVLTASDQIIYNPITYLDCSNSVRKSNFTGTLLLEVDYGLSTGEAGISMNVTSSGSVSYSVKYDGTTYSSVTSGLDSITFQKVNMLPRKAFVTVDVAEPTDFEVSGNCVVLQQFTVISIVNGNTENEGQTIANRYKWVSGNYSSNFKVFETIFKEDGISLYNEETGDEGTDAIPLTDAKLIMQSYQGFSHTGSFGDNDTLNYLITETYYSEAQASDVITASNQLTPTIEETQGGERIVTAEFNVARPLLEQYLYLIWDYSGLSINKNTNIYIYFDSSGSMDSTLAPLIEMRDTVLKDALLPLYDYDEIAYDEKVQVITNSTERTVDMLNFLNQNPEGNVISLVFQDEAHNIYHEGSGWTVDSARTTTYNSDIQTLRERINGFPANYYRGIVFQVATPDTNQWMVNFKAMMDAVQNGLGSYSGVYGLSDRGEVAFKYDVTPASTAEYYKDLIVNALRELGYNL